MSMEIELRSNKDVTVIDLERLNPDELKAMADKLQFGLVVSLLDSLNRLDEETDRVSKLRNRVMEYVERKIGLELEAESLQYDEALEIFVKLSNVGISVAEVKRKVFNGKDLLKVDPFTKQERAMMDLLRSVNTPDKKQRLVDFIHSMDEFDTPKDTDESKDLNSDDFAPEGDPIEDDFVLGMDPHFNPENPQRSEDYFEDDEKDAAIN